MIALITHVGDSFMFGFLVYFDRAFHTGAIITVLVVAVMSHFLVYGLDMEGEGSLAGQLGATLITGEVGSDIQMSHFYVILQNIGS